MERTLIEVHDLIHATPQMSFHLTEEQIRILFSFVTSAPHIGRVLFGGTDADMHLCDFTENMLSMFDALIVPSEDDPDPGSVQAIGPWPMPLIHVADRIIHAIINGGIGHFTPGRTPMQAMQALCKSYGPIRILAREEIATEAEGRIDVDVPVESFPIVDSLQFTQSNAKQFMQ